MLHSQATFCMLHSEMFYKKGVLKNFANLLKKRLWHRRFPVNFAKYLRTPFLQKASGCLFLYIVFGARMSVLFFEWDVRLLLIPILLRCYFSQKH